MLCDKQVCGSGPFFSCLIRIRIRIWKTYPDTDPDDCTYINVLVERLSYFIKFLSIYYYFLTRSKDGFN
jgi:hypothetical protein